MAPLVTLYPDRFTPEAMTLEAFSAAASLVASRAFGVDPVHGDGMVPLADIFNHKVSVVDLAPGYAVHGHDSSSDDEGDSEGAEGSQEEGDSDGEPSADGESDSSSGSEGGDGDSLHGGEEHEQHRNGGSGFGSVMRAGDEPPSLYGITSANGLHLGLHIAIVDCDDHLQIVAASAVPQGEALCHYLLASLAQPFFL